METLFYFCCNVIHKLADILNISYSACNILLFLHILPCIYLLCSFGIGISGFFKKSKYFGIFNIIIGYLGGLYSIEYLYHNLSEYTLDVNSFNKAVLMLEQCAANLGCTYIDINILLFIICPILIFTTTLILIMTNNKFTKHDH